jgi:hypothetical protein
MTSPANDTSELTAYSLGELHPHQAHEIHRLLSECPAATSELEQIEAVTDALRQRAPIPQDRLLPEQRHTVLRPTNIPRRVLPMMPRQIVQKRSSVWPVVGGLLKAAAMIALTGAAYWVGRHADVRGREPAVAADSPVKPALPAPEKMTAKVSAPKAEPQAVKTSPVRPAPAVVVTTPAPAPKTAESPAVKTPVALVAAAPVKAELPEKRVVSAPAPAPVIPKAVTRPVNDVAFISTSRQESDQFSLRPADIRPLPVKAGKADFASPVLVKPAPEMKPSAKVAKADVYIHSWKAEIASCPWNKSTRLMRITVQLPADQPAASTSNAYPLQVSFDRRYVREFRRLSERHIPAVELRSAGSQTVWYEFQPVSDEVMPAGKPVALVTLDKGRFTTQTVGPFDGSKLNVQDRGITWQAAREDFVFESAVVGLGMLLRGDHQSPGLDHRLVLTLAEKSKGSDASGERGRFIRQVSEVRRAAGL